MKNILKLLLSGAFVYFVFFYLYKFIIGTIFNLNIYKGNFIAPAIIFISLVVLIFIIFYKSISLVIDGIKLKIAKKVIGGFVIIISIMIIIFILKTITESNYNKCGVGGCKQTPIYPCIPNSEYNNCE